MPTSYINIDAINHINAELSNYCNAACPMCARFDHEQNLIKALTNNSHTTLDDIKHRVGVRVIKNLVTFRSCGNVGDGTMNPECLHIYEFVKITNPKTYLGINTNGGARNPDFYKEMARLGVEIIFSIDGLRDTNHLYRRNVNWDKLMANAEAFISAGGRAYWDFLIFKHNQHQVTEAEEISKKMGFVSFQRKSTTRWDDFDSEGNWMQRSKISIDGHWLEKPIDELQEKYANKQDQKHKEVQRKQINCNSFYNGNVEIFIHANGNISPCCWLGDLSIHESKNIIDDYKSVNIKHSSLQEILEGNFFNEVWKGIKGEPQLYKLTTCENVCGVCYE